MRYRIKSIGGRMYIEPFRPWGWGGSFFIPAGLSFQEDSPLIP